LVEADPGMADVLAAVPAVPMSEVGHAADDTGDHVEGAGWFY
jgi:hypothetical protein